MTIILIAIADIEAAHAATDGQYLFLSPAGNTADGAVTHRFAVFRSTGECEAALTVAGVPYASGSLAYETAHNDRASWLLANGLVMSTEL